MITRFYLLVCFVVFIGLFPGCERVTDWDLKTGENGALVVESIIMNSQNKMF